MNQSTYVALIFTQTSYDAGLLDTLELVKSEFPNSTLVFEKYVVNATIEETDNALTDFIQKYPTGNKVTLSELTSILNEILNYLENNNLDIFSISVNATSLLFQKRKNLFTFGYYLDKSVMTSFLIIQEYALQNIVILIDNKSVNFTFLNSFSTVIQKQNNLLHNLPLQIYDLSNPLQKINIPKNSFVYLLADTSTITNNFINPIMNAFKNNTTSCIFLTNINSNIKDIFGNIPAFVSVLRSADFTETSNKVYNNLKNKSSYSYEIYPFYDCCYTLQFMLQNNIKVNNENYLNTNPFQTFPAAYSNSFQLDSKINGFAYGVYNIVLTKNTILNTPELLSIYNKYNSNDGSIFRLPNSQSILLTLGIVPFFASNIFWNDQNLIKIYDKSTLMYVKFDTNDTKDKNSNSIAVSQIQPPKFIINYDDETGLFKYLEKIYNNRCKTNPAVNPTMSKIPQIFYL